MFKMLNKFIYNTTFPVLAGISIIFMLIYLFYLCGLVQVTLINHDTRLKEIIVKIEESHLKTGGNFDNVWRKSPHMSWYNEQLLILNPDMKVPNLKNAPIIQEGSGIFKSINSNVVSEANNISLEDLEPLADHIISKSRGRASYIEVVEE